LVFIGIYLPLVFISIYLSLVLIPLTSPYTAGNMELENITKNSMWQTIGQPKIVDLLKRALQQGTLSHAYLLVGPAQVGKMTLALDLARVLNCQAEKDRQPCGECPSCQKIASGKHADIQIISLNPDAGSEDTKAKAEIGIEQVREMLHSASLPPFEGKCRVYIVDEAAHLSLDAANRLLKTLEEPNGSVVFILLTENARLVPATIISRCQRLNLSRMKTSELESHLTDNRRIDASKSQLLSRLAGGRPGWAIRALEDPGLLQSREERFARLQSLVKGDYTERFAFAAQLALQFSKKRETVYDTLDTWLSWWRDLLLAKTNCAGDIINIDFMSDLATMARTYSLAQIKSVIQNILEAEEQLKLNANSRLVLESLMLNLPRG
jgi:DNA polymerase III subunit delta'